MVRPPKGRAKRLRVIIARRKSSLVFLAVTVLFAVALWTCESAFAGHLVAWGSNDYGQCDVPEGDDFVAISAAWGYNVALKSDGSLVAWGSNDYGQCDVPEGDDFVAISSGT
ncbi:MAG: hypothetical protein DRP62_06235, partial [Planctomycetota bacterium]